ncbi:MAG: thermonuclease family protein [Beijerinckiaceae bacterium]|jgi:endonuclease YncB( thermonuclease family)|nr:thermonuclease family protein [Beijerinckiaceae bacterium]
MFRPRFLSAAVFIAACVLLAAALNRKAEEMVVGAARAIDGDSLVVNGREMRLEGIDAPEARQLCNLAGQSIPCGRQATQALQRWLARGPAACTGHENDRYGRLLVICRVNGTDINADLVRNGFAVDFGRYPAEEKEARAAYRGLWGGTFEVPAEYRRRIRAEAEAKRTSSTQP